MGWITMTPQEVLEQLAQHGINITIRTLQRWVNDELIPTPESGIYKTGGRWTQYPSGTVEEFMATHTLLNHNELPVKRPTAATVRKKALDPLEELHNPTNRAFLFYGDIVNPFVEIWLTTYEKVRAGWPIDKPAEVEYKYTLAEPMNIENVPEYVGTDIVDAPENRVRLRIADD